METKHLIQSQANVIKITSLVQGSVVKILEKDYSSYTTYYGIVIDLLNSGSKTFIQILRYKQSYGSIDAEIKTYTGEEDLNIFPAKVEEVEAFFADTLKSVKRKVEDKKRDLQKEVEALEKLEEFVSGEKQKELLEASYTSLTQEEYDRKLKELN